MNAIVTADPRADARAPSVVRHAAANDDHPLGGPYFNTASTTEAAQHVDERASLLQSATMPITFVQGYAKEQAELDHLALEFPVFAFFVIFFASLTFSSVESEHYNDLGAGLLHPLFHTPMSLGPDRNASELPFSTSLQTIVQLSDFFPWADRLLLPSIYSRPSASTLGLPALRQGPGSSILFGAMRVRVVNVGTDNCNPNPSLLPRFKSNGGVCYGRYQAGADAAPVVDLRLGAKEVSCSSLTLGGDIPTDRYSLCKANVVDFSLNLTLSAARSLLFSSLRDSGVVSVATRLIFVTIPIYAPVDDLLALNTITVEASETMAVRTEDAIYPCDTYVNDRYLVSLAFNVIFLLVIFGQYVYVARAGKDAYDEGTLIEWLLRPWTILDAVNFTAFLIYYGFYFAWIRYSLILSTAPALSFSAQPGQLVTHSGTYDVRLEEVAWFVQVLQICNGINTVLTFLRVLKFCNLTARLAIVVRTFFLAIQHIINILVIFFIVVIAYSLAGVALFGSAMLRYSDLTFAMSSSVRLLVGDYDYDTMRMQNSFFAGVFFWSFVIVCTFVLLNALVAVLRDSFQRQVRRLRTPSLSESFANFVLSLTRVIVRIWNVGPLTYVKNSVSLPCVDQSTNLNYIRMGRLKLVTSSLQRHRYNLALEDTSAEYLDSLDREDRDVMLPGPVISFAHFIAILRRDRQLNDDAIAFLGDRFLEDFWMDAHVEYQYTSLQDNQLRKREREAQVGDVVEAQLRELIHSTRRSASSGRKRQLLQLRENDLRQRYAMLFGGLWQMSEYVAVISDNTGKAEEALRSAGEVIARGMDDLSRLLRDSNAEAAAGGKPCPAGKGDRQKNRADAAARHDDAEKAARFRFYSTDRPLPMAAVSARAPSGEGTNEAHAPTYGLNELPFVDRTGAL